MGVEDGALEGEEGRFIALPGRCLDLTGEARANWVLDSTRAISALL